MKPHNFKVGDRVKVISLTKLKEISKEYKQTPWEAYRMPEGVSMVSSMIKQCGKIVTIARVSNPVLCDIKEADGLWTTLMFDLGPQSILKDLYE